MSETKTLRALMDRAASWSDEAQAELIRSMLEIEARHYGVVRLDEDDRARIRHSLEQAQRGEFASDEEVAALFARYRT